MGNSNIIIDGQVAKWRLPNIIGDLGGTYVGAFEFRCFLDPLRQLQAGREFRELLGQYRGGATDTEINVAFALTQLKYRILKAPPFWTSTLSEDGIEGNIGDLNVILAVLDAAIEAENIYKDKMMKERDILLEKSIKAAEEKLQKGSEVEGE